MKLFEQGMFTIDPNATPDQLARRRERIADLMSRTGKARYVGEGLGHLATGILGGKQMRDANKLESEKRQEADNLFSSLLTGFGGGSRMSSRGTYAPPKAPNPSDEMYPTGKPGPAPEGNVDPASGLDMGTPVNFDLREGIIQTAEAIGADPLDLATAISYETAGTFDPMKAGPTTQWGQHRGLIQFGEPQAGQYGVDFSSPEAALASQLGADGAVAKYFKSSGFQPGMPGIDLYSTINAGAPGRYSASDANNGGAAGDVADKWNNQMEGHRAKAAALLGGEYVPASGGREVLAAQNAPGAGNMVQLQMALANPWLTPAQKQVIASQIQTQQQASDPIRQMQIEKARLELEKLRNGGGAELPSGVQELQWRATQAGLKPGTPEYQSFILNGGGDPATFRALHMQAVAAGFEPDTPEYNEFMATRGAGLQAGAKTTATNLANIETGGEAAAVEDAAKQAVKLSGEAWGQFGRMTKAIGTIDQAISAIDAGAKSGAVEKFFPNITEASATLNTAMNEMGLDVISMVTFGALSEAEMRLAMETAAPRNLDEPDLRNWLVKKREANQKAANALADAAEFLSKPGNTLNGWIEKNRGAGSGGGVATHRFNPETGKIEAIQ